MAEQNKSNLQQDYFGLGCKQINPKYCKTCMFSHGEPPFADLPEKSYCMIFDRASGKQKPSEVYYDGKPCEYYEKQKLND